MTSNGDPQRREPNYSCAWAGCGNWAMQGRQYCETHGGKLEHEHEKVVRSKKSEDPTNPRHYRSHPSGIECIQVTEFMSFCLGNAVKYVWRVDSDLREGLAQADKLRTDLRKAIWYIEREIKRLG